MRYFFRSLCLFGLIALPACEIQVPLEAPSGAELRRSTHPSLTSPPSARPTQVSTRARVETIPSAKRDKRGKDPDVAKDPKSPSGLDDPISLTEEEKAAAYAALDKKIRDKLLGLDGKDTNSKRIPSQHWVIRFNTKDGKNYLEQLASLKAVVIVPLPPKNKEIFIFRDLIKPKPGTKCSDADWDEMEDKLHFGDFKKDSVDGLRQALGMDEEIKEFWAFFPKEMEEEMAALEKGYRNRKPEDIEKTMFRVVLRNGKYVLTVEDQLVKQK